jgi:peptidyl-prolyl cis-trans isomerase C
MMVLSVNGATVPADAIAREVALHADAPDPEAAARRTLAVRELILQRAGELGLLENGLPRERVTFAGRAQEDDVIAQVLENEVTTPKPTLDECRRYYETHPERFTSGELVEARHILFAIMPGTPVMALREHAERILAELKAAPGDFAARAQALSNCPSGQHGGNLGQFGRGEMVPEFDQAVFGTPATGVLPALAATRYGFHIIAVERRIPGRRLPFDAVANRVAEYLAARVEERALKQYVEVLSGRAAIAGADLAGAASPLVQ